MVCQQVKVQEIKMCGFSGVHRGLEHPNSELVQNGFFHL